MTVLDVRTDPEARTLTLTAGYPAPPADVWQLWADPRLLERWWGPPAYPATFTEHDLRAGGKAAYFMTGPEGDRHFGWWEFTAVEPAAAIELEDGFATADGTPDASLPTTVMRMTLEERPEGGTVMTIVSTFPSSEALEQMLAMGMAEGMREAVGQTDALLEGAATG